MQLAQISEAVGGQMIGVDVSVSGVTTDTRSDCHNELFIALRGERFDAHDYVQQAKKSGASAALLERDVVCDMPKVIVKDTHLALQKLAAWWRTQHVLPVVGVTGSAGKTSVKEMLACIFSEVGEGLVTKGNLNNEIGVPLTLLSLEAGDQYAIVEMGMNHAGEISRLTNITQPTIALVNNAGAAHLEGLGTVEAVAHAKGEIFEGLSDDGIAIINADDQYLELWQALVNENLSKSVGKRKVITFGINNKASVFADYELEEHGIKMHVTAFDSKFSVELGALGEHNVSNGLAAIATALAANIPIKKIQAGMQRYRPVSGRLAVELLAGVTLIDDTYNANPASMRAAINVLSQYENNILIVGDMAELGRSAEEEHRNVGNYADKNNIDCLYACGVFSALTISDFNGEKYGFTSQDELVKKLLSQSFDGKDLSGVTILVKGSRSAKMEKVVEHLRLSLGQSESTKTNEGHTKC